MNFNAENLLVKDGNLWRQLANGGGVDMIQVSKLETLPGKEKFNGEYATSGDAQDIKHSIIQDQKPEVSGVGGDENEGFFGDIQVGVWHTREGLSLTTLGVLGTPVEYLLACFEGDDRVNQATAFTQQVAIALLGEELGQDNYSEQWG